MNNHVTVLEIDGKALEHNLNYFKKILLPTTKILAVVKAFSYGSDEVKVASFLQDKIDYFAVAYAHEGTALRKANIRKPILVLHPQIVNFQSIIDSCLEPNLYSFETFYAFLKLAKINSLTDYPIHLKFNTGLNRLGFLPSDVPKIIDGLRENKHVKIQSLFSHLAASEDLKERDFTNRQIESFKNIVSEFDAFLKYKPLLHICNTSGVINYTDAQFDMVRIGIGLYGFGNDDYETSQLKNTHNLSSIISQIHEIEAGNSVGYNRAFKATKKTRSATIPIGHADGISRALGNSKGFVTINHQKAPILGNVCMDMIMVDVTNIDCKEGDKAIIFDHQKTIQEFADAAETITYEILTGISHRVKKVLKD
jgi:alanine racemase